MTGRHVRVEWQVWHNATGTDRRRECHIFPSEEGAETFAKTLPEPVCREGGLWYPGPVQINKVVRHRAPQKEES